MIPDRLQYFLEHFWKDQTCDQIWTLGPHIYHQNTSRNIRKLWKHPWFSYLRIWNSDVFEGLCTHLLFLFLLMIKCSKLENKAMEFAICILKTRDFDFWYFEILKLRNLEVWQATFLISKLLKSWQIEDGEREMMKIPVNKFFKILDMNFISIKNHEMGNW